MTDPNTPNRRRFLKIAGGAVLATAAVGSGLIAVGTRQPALDLRETTYPGEDAMSKKVLVAYASKCGSTAEVADAIGKTLQQQGFAVDVRPAKQVTDVSAYQGVLVGSAIRMGNWLADAKKFVQTHQSRLATMPAAYFSVCMVLDNDTPENQKTALAYADPLRALVEPVAVGAFAGKMAYETLSFFDRLIITKMVKTPEGDFRNWDAIRTWTHNVSSTIG